MKDQFSTAGKSGYYRPFATSAPYLVFLLAITLSLIALTEYALHIIPTHAGIGKLSNVVDTVEQLHGRGFADPKRQEASILDGAPPTSTIETGSPTDVPAGRDLLLENGGAASKPLSPTGVPAGGDLALENGSPAGEPLSSTPFPTGGDLQLQRGSSASEPLSPTSTPAGGDLQPENGSPASASLPPVFTAVGGYLEPGNGNPAGEPLSPTAWPTGGDVIPGGGDLQPQNGGPANEIPSPTPFPAEGGLQLSNGGPGIASTPIEGGLRVGAVSTTVAVTAAGGDLQFIGGNPTVTSTPRGGDLGVQDIGPTIMPTATGGDLKVGGGQPEGTATGGDLEVGGGGQPTVTTTATGGDLEVGGGGQPTVTATATGGDLNLGGESQAEGGSGNPTGQPQGGGLILGGDTPTPPTPVETLPTPAPAAVDDSSALPGNGVSDLGAPSLTDPPIPGATAGSSQSVGTATLGPLNSIATGQGYIKSAGVTTTVGMPAGGYLTTTTHSGMSSALGKSGSFGSTTSKPVATVINANGTFYSMPDGTTARAPQINFQQYVMVAFLPLILSVLYTMPWRILDTGIREMEPFYQLHNAGGATAEDSLCLEYTTSVTLAMPFKSLRRGHMYVFWSSLISIAVLVLTPLSSEVFFVSLSGECHANAPKGSCHAAWGVYATLARVAQGILAFIAVLTILILIFGFNRKSGVHSEPLSIAGKAVLFHKSPLIRGFREVDSCVSNEDLKLIMKGKRFGTAPFTSDDSTQCYGILPVDYDFEAGFTSQPQAVGHKGHYSLVQTTELSQEHGIIDPIRTLEDRKSGGSRKAIIMEKIYYVSALLLFSGALVLVAYYHWTSGDTGFERFMDSEGFGVRFMLVTVGIALKLFWANIDENLRRMEPYRRLLRGNVRPENSILIPVWMSPISAIIPSLRRSHFLVALVSFVSVLSEFLPIGLANSTFSAANTRQALVICSYVSIVILLLMIVSVLILLVRPTHHTGRLPRTPTNIASALLYITDSEGERTRSMLDSFEGLSMVSKRERNEYIRNLRARYTMGLAFGNQLRIDEDRNVHRLWTG